MISPVTLNRMVGRITRAYRLFNIIYVSRDLPRFSSSDNCIQVGRELIDAKQFREADAFILNALAVHPRSIGLHMELALNADQGGRFAEARDRWSRLCGRWPNIPRAWSGIAANHRQLGDIDEGLSVITQALERFPNDLDVLSEAVRLANRSKAPRDAASLWRRLVNVDISPNPSTRVRSYLGDLTSLSELMVGMPDGENHLLAMRTESLLEINSDRSLIEISKAAIDKNYDAFFLLVDADRKRYDRNPIVAGFLPDPVLSDLASAAFDRRYGQPALTCAIFKHVSARYPDDPFWWSLYTEALLLLGRLDEAAAVLGQQKPRFPGFSGFLLNSGFLAMKRGEWSAAFEHFAAHQAIHPDDAVVRDLISRTKMEQSAASEESGTVSLATLRQDVGTEENDAVRSLLLGFESLGNDCEFGLVQRRFGAEPISLFRWNATNPDSLVECLDAKLLGLGEAENTVMSTFADHEYYLSDKRWGFGFHTFMTAHEIQADRLFPKMCRRMTYLREKFIGDLQEGRKIFVFKSPFLDIPVARALHASLCAYGAARLLWVTTVAAAGDLIAGDAQSGGVYRLDEGLCVGFVSRFGN